MRSQELERTMGIEPTSSAWEAEVLPLNYARAAAKSMLDSDSRQVAGAQPPRGYGSLEFADRATGAAAQFRAPFGTDYAGAEACA